MAYEFLTYNIQDQIAEIALQRAPVNALNHALIDEILAAFAEAAGDDDVRAVILRSAFEKVFCAGLDLDVVSGTDGQAMRRFLEKLYFALTDTQYRLGKPSIAVVEGAARAGGMTLAVSCDVVIAGAHASFGYPEIDVGLILALHFVHLPRQAGRHTAFEWLFTGEKFDAATALDLGIVNHVVPAGEAQAKAQALARNFAAKSPQVMRLARQAFMRANDLDYRRGIENVAETMCNVVATEDSKEGLAAFLEIRPPRWQQ